MSKTVVLTSWGSGAPSLCLDVPENFKLVQERGPDFVIFYLVPGDSSATTDGAALGIYVGHSPNPFSKGHQSSLEPMRLHDRTFDWHVWKTEEPSGTFVHKECIIQDLFRNVAISQDAVRVRELAVHLFLKAIDPQLVDVFQQSAHSVRLSTE